MTPEQVLLNKDGYNFEIKQNELSLIYEKLRPAVIWKPRLFLDGEKWCALYGDDLQDGVAGFGNSPDKAMIDFDKNWIKEI